MEAAETVAELGGGKTANRAKENAERERSRSAQKCTLTHLICVQSPVQLFHWPKVHFGAHLSDTPTAIVILSPSPVQELPLVLAGWSWPSASNSLIAFGLASA